MFNVLVADRIQEDGLQPLIEMDNITLIHSKTDDITLKLEEVDALLIRSATKVTEQLLDQMPRLKIVARAGVGVDNIDVPAATKRGVIVVNAPDGNTISTAEHTFAMMASLVRNIPQAHVTMKNYEWKRNEFAGTELSNKTLGIVGFGRIGSELAKRAKAFNMNVVVFDPFLTTERAEKMGIKNLSFDQLLTESDIITVHTPLTKDTRGILNHSSLSKTKKGVYILNCARGGIIDEQALYDLIKAGHVQGAALDVFVEEPPGDHPLLKLDNVIATPHLGASTKEAQLNVAIQVANEVRLHLEGKPVSNSINLPSISKDIFEKIGPYHNLVKQMGKIISQYMKEGVNEITISYSGNVMDLDKSYLTKALLADFFKERMDSHVNEVNALLIAKERGVTVGEKNATKTYGYANCIQVTVKGDEHSFTIRGTYIDNYGPRIVAINDFNIDFDPQGNLLYIEHMDRPGVIGRVGKLLGDLEINIATMQVGRKQAGGEAIMMLSFDRSLDDESINEIHKIQDIVSLHQLNL